MSNVSTLRSHSREFLTEVIELYKNQPCLWKIKSKEYYDRAKKAKAYALLVEKFKESEKGAVDRKLVAKKINCLRSSYRMEKKKISDAAELGREYRTNLWCFDLLRFLDVNDIHLQRTSFINVDSVEDDSNDSVESPEYLQISSDVYDDLANPSTAPRSPDSDATSQLKTKDPIGFPNKTIGALESTRRNRNRTENSARKRRDARLDHAIYELLGHDKGKARRLRRRHDDSTSRTDELGAGTQFDYASKAWAVTLKELPRTQQLYASRIINEVLFQAQIGKLNEDTRLVLSAPKTPNEDGPITLECLDAETMEFDVKGEA